MKPLRQLLVRAIYVLVFACFSTFSYSQFFSSSDFESNLGIWNDGGSDAARRQFSSLSGLYSVRLRDNSGVGSSIFTNPIDLGSSPNLRISFDYFPESMEPGEKFFLEYSPNGGASYEVIGKWISGTDFNNGVKYSETLVLNRFFTTQSVFRFRCDASTNYDLIYLDNIIIEDDCAVCPTVIAPVCGTDGNTYVNSCEAECAGVGVAFNGPCDPIEQCELLLATIDFDNLCSQCITEVALYEFENNAYLVYFPNTITCGDGAIVVKNCLGQEVFCQQGGIAGLQECNTFFANAVKVRTVAQENCGCICPDVYAPVCGTDGITYGNSCEAACVGVGVAFQGACDPLQECENIIASMNFNNLCDRCITRVDLYLYQGAYYLVNYPNNATCADGAIVVTDCLGGIFCQQGGIAGLTECNAFFASATRIRTIAEENCGCNCPQVYQPVCGIDGQTYGNGCEAFCAGVPVAYQGTCDCICPAVYDPVCGVDGNTYSNSCVAACSGVAVAFQGACDPLQECENNIASMDFNNLCARCISRVDLYQYQGAYYLVNFPNNATCADGAIVVTDCLGGIFCQQGGIAGLTECDAFFASATRIRTIAEENCGCNCPQVYQPVCGIDGQTYGNACQAFCAGVPVAYNGLCDCVCTLQYDPVCGTDGNTYSNACFAACAGVAVAYIGVCDPCEICDTDEYDPVCGVNGQTYVTACWANCAGVAIAYNGSCGSCPLFNQEGFESGMGIWNDGGSDSFRKNDYQFASNGNYSIRLRDDSGIQSSIYTDVINMSLVTKLSIEFNYKANSMEPGEDFFLEYSADGGNTFSTINSWVSGSDFLNGQSKGAVVELSDNFSSQSVFRLRCDASSNYDQVYIDDIKLYICGNVSLAEEAVTELRNAESTSEHELEEEAGSLVAYPNPTTQMVNIEGLNGSSYDLHNITGEIILSNKTDTTLDMSSLPSGTYLLRTYTGKIIRIFKI